jgi:hypothetical protein
MCYINTYIIFYLNLLFFYKELDILSNGYLIYGYIFQIWILKMI